MANPKGRSLRAITSPFHYHDRSTETGTDGRLLVVY